MYCNTKSCTLFQPLGDTQYTYLKLLYSMTIYLLICVKGCLSMENNIGHMDFYPAGNFWFLSLCFTSIRTNLLKQAFLYCFHQHKFCLFSKRNIGKPTSVLWIFRLWIFFLVNVFRRCFNVVVGYKMSLLPMISVWYLISRRILLPFVYPVSCRIPAMTSDIWPDTGYD